jgi:hypothetical protein
MIDEPNEYLSGDEQVEELRRQIAGLQVRVAVLERQLQQVDLLRLREEMADLRARVDLFTRHRDLTGGRVDRLGTLTLCVLAIAAANLVATLLLVGK